MSFPELPQSAPGDVLSVCACYQDGRALWAGSSTRSGPAGKPNAHERLPEPVIDAMADRAMRLHHMLWHRTRDSWADLAPEERKVFNDHGWVPSRPSLGPTDPATGDRPVELGKRPP
jgi:hypothetical protein